MSFTETDNIILQHLALYEVGITKLLNEIVPSGDANNSIVALRRSKLVNYFTQNHGGEHLIAGTVSWCSLTKHGCAEMGVPSDRARNKAITSKIAVFWHCITAGAVKLEMAEVEALTGWKPPKNVTFIISPEPMLYRAYVATSDERTTVGSCWRIADELIDSVPHFSKRMGVLVLAGTKQKSEAITTTLKEGKNEPPVPVIVRLGPTPDSLPDYLAERRAKRARPNGN